MSNLINPHRFMTGGGGFLPSDISGLQFWYDADDAGTITEIGGEVSDWDDKSGNGRHLEQLTAANQPNTSTLGGKNTLFFDGNDVLESLGNTLSLEPETRFVVAASADAASGINYILSVDLLDIYVRKNAAAVNSVHAGTDSSAPSAASILGVDLPFAVITRNEDTTGGDILSDDGTSDTDTASGLQSSFSDIRVGARTGSGTQGWDSHIMEVGMYSQRLSDSDRTTLMDYLKTKWGL